MSLTMLAMLLFWAAITLVGLHALLSFRLLSAMLRRPPPLPGALLAASITESWTAVVWTGTGLGLCSWLSPDHRPHGKDGYP
jgi:hypothetical protein